MVSFLSFPFHNFLFYIFKFFNWFRFDERKLKWKIKCFFYSMYFNIIFYFLFYLIWIHWSNSMNFLIFLYEIYYSILVPIKFINLTEMLVALIKRCLSFILGQSKNEMLIILFQAIKKRILFRIYFVHKLWFIFLANLIFLDFSQKYLMFLTIFS